MALAVGNIPFHLKTAFLFTKSDFKTTVLPCTIFGAAIAPLAGLSRIPHVAFWAWLQIFCFDIANQALFPDEDRLNKPYRPIPSGRISIENALKLRWVMVMIGFIHSAFYSVETVYAAVGNLIIALLYCELRVDAMHWTIRTLIGGVGYIPYLAGAILVAGSDPHTIDSFGIYALAISAGIYGTTYCAQDFKDVAGDKAVGRQTFPIVHPTFSRIAYLLLALFWSIAVSMDLQIKPLFACIPVALGFLTGARFVLWNSVKSDQLSFVFHGIWVYSIFLVMGYYRNAMASHMPQFASE